jgi:hypothetical protein
MFYERQHKPRRGSLVILSEGFLCLRIDRKVCEHILVTPLGNRSSPAIDYDVPLCQLRVWYINYLSAPQTYNPNVVDRSHVVISVSSSHVNMHNSYTSTDMSRWSNHNAYMFEHVSNIHNGFVPPYSSTESASHCTPQIHMSMSNYYSRTDLRTLTDFDQSLYTAQIQLEWRLHRIWFQHHLSCLVCSIWLHLFIAE